MALHCRLFGEQLWLMGEALLLFTVLTRSCHDRPTLATALTQACAGPPRRGTQGEHLLGPRWAVLGLYETRLSKSLEIGKAIQTFFHLAHHFYSRAFGAKADNRLVHEPQSDYKQGRGGGSFV